MIKSAQLFLTAFILGFLSTSIAFGQELPIPNPFSYGGNSSISGIFNNDIHLTAELVQIRYERAYIWLSNTSGKEAVVVFNVNGNVRQLVTTAPKGRSKVSPLLTGFTGFYFCYCFVNPKVVDIKYVLPVSEGKLVNVEKGAIEYPQVYEDGLSKFFGTRFKLQAGDTIRAVRGGVIETLITQKDKELERFNRLTIRHADQTASDYIGFEARSVTAQEGDEIFTGMPLARAGGSSLANSSDLFFATSYIKLDVKKEFKNWTSIVFMDPTFATETYEGALVHNERYVCFINTELIIQEMSKKVKKQFRRGK